MATNEIEVNLIGKDRSLSKSLKKGAADAHTFSGKLRLIGSIFKNLFTGNFKQAGAALKTLAGGFGGFATIAIGAIGAVVIAIGSLVVFILSAKRAYEAWMTGIVKITRMTGLSAAATSRLAVQFRLSGVEAEAGATGLGFFAKNLDKYRQATAKAARPLAVLKKGSEGYAKALATVKLAVKDAGGPFTRLGIALRDQEGKLRPVAALLDIARNRLSKIADPAKRAGIAAALFGRGFKTMLPWLMKSAEKIREYVKWTKDLGLVMGKRSTDAFKDYRENQRKLSLGWDAIKINAYGALVPLINSIMPRIIKVIWSAAGWLGKFRKLVEKKGWGTALRKMVPGLKGIEDGARAVAAYVKKNWPAAKQVLLSVGRALVKVAAWADRNKVAFRILSGALKAQSAVMGVVIGLLRITWTVGSTVVSVIKKIADVVWTVTTGGFNALFNVIQNIISAAQTAYNWLQKLGDGGPTRTPGTRGGGRGGSATGGIATGPMSGYRALLHGTEMVIPMNGNRHTPNRVVDYGGGGAAAMTLNVNVVVPGGTTLIGTAREVAEILAPHVSAAVARSLARKGRGR